MSIGSNNVLRVLTLNTELLLQIHLDELVSWRLLHCENLLSQAMEDIACKLCHEHACGGPVTWGLPRRVLRYPSLALCHTWSQLHYKLLKLWIDCLLLLVRSSNLRLWGITPWLRVRFVVVSWGRASNELLGLAWRGTASLESSKVDVGPLVWGGTSARRTSDNLLRGFNTCILGRSLRANFCNPILLLLGRGKELRDLPIEVARMLRRFSLSHAPHSYTSRFICS